MLVENSFGKLFDFYLVLHYMDDEICGEIDFENSPCSEQEFFDIYCLKHFQSLAKLLNLPKETLLFKREIFPAFYQNSLKKGVDKHFKIW